MKKNVAIYSKLEHIPGNFGKRIAPFVVLSCVLHLALAISMYSRTSYGKQKKENTRKPIIVDFMEHKEGLSPEPASLSPTPRTPQAAPRDIRPQTPPRAAPKQPAVKTKQGKSAKVRQRKAERKGVSRSRHKKAVKATPEKTKTVDASPRALPSARDLVPSLQDLMNWQAKEARLYRAPFEQDGVGENPAQVQYNAYLSTLKQRVKERWNVSSVTDIRDATTVVWFIIGDNGSLRSLKIARSSGRVLLDKKAMDAIRNSFPLAAPPKALLDENGLIHVQFSFRYMVYSPYSKNPWKGKNKWIVD